MRHKRITLLAGLFTGALTLGGCNDASNTNDQSSATDADGAHTHAAWLVHEAPQGAVDVAAAKQSAAEGDRIVVRGVIGGRRDAISAESPVFIIMDPAVPSCADNPDDACRTPWDYCCETPQTIAAGSATVQIVDDSADAGNIRESGLSELDEVIVEGVVGPRPEDDVLVIRARRVYRSAG